MTAPDIWLFLLLIAVVDPFPELAGSTAVHIPEKIVKRMCTAEPGHIGDTFRRKIGR